EPDDGRVARVGGGAGAVAADPGLLAGGALFRDLGSPGDRTAAVIAFHDGCAARGGCGWHGGLAGAAVVPGGVVRHDRDGAAVPRAAAQGLPVCARLGLP